MLLHSAMILPLEDVCIDHAPHLREGKWRATLSQIEAIAVCNCCDQGNIISGAV